MIRGVLDTNVIVSAVLRPLGLPARIFTLALGDALQFFIYDSIYSEYKEVLRRPRLKLSESVIAGTLARLGASVRGRRDGQLHRHGQCEGFPAAISVSGSSYSSSISGS